jgi:hypothetical protein
MTEMRRQGRICKGDAHVRSEIEADQTMESKQQERADMSMSGWRVPDSRPHPGFFPRAHSPEWWPPFPPAVGPWMA